MKKLWALVIKELRCLGRDWHGLMVLFLMPAAFILIMSFALKDTFKPELNVLGDPLIVASPSEELEWLLQSLQLQHVRPISAEERSAEKLSAEFLSQHHAKYAVVLTPQFDRDFWNLQLPVKAEIYVTPDVSMAVVQSIKAVWERGIVSVRVQHVLAPQLENAGIALKADQLSFVSAEFLSDENVPLTSVQQSVPAWMVFGMFFVVIPLSTIIIQEREQKTLFRLSSMEVGAHLLLLGKWLPFFLVNIIQALAMVAVGAWLVPLLGGDALNLSISWPLFVGVLIVTSTVALGFAFLVASFAHTNEQATMMGGVGNILFGALGGVMVPTFIMPEEMRLISQFSPMHWGVESFSYVFTGQASLGEIAPYMGYSLVIGVLMFGLASYKLQRDMQR